MLRAIELSIQSAKTKGGPFGCVIVKDNKIIAEGFNQVTSNNDPTAHAEIVAIRNACKNQKDFFLKGCDLGGYNLLKFDVPLLIEEFIRNDFEKNSCKENGLLFRKKG